VLFGLFALCWLDPVLDDPRRCSLTKHWIKDAALASMERGELHCVVSHKSVWLFPRCQEHQRPLNDTSNNSGIPQSCLGCVSQSASLQTVRLKLSKAKFWLKNVDSQLARLHDLIFGNQEIRQAELWNFAQWDILSLVPGKVLWRKCIGGLGAKINRALMWNHYRSPSPSPIGLPWLGKRAFLETTLSLTEGLTLFLAIFKKNHNFQSVRARD
jgi:hypothetical protein